MQTKVFKDVPIGTQFKVRNKTYEKTAEARGGCCNKSFNAFCLDTEEPAIFRRDTHVELL